MCLQRVKQLNNLRKKKTMQVRAKVGEIDPKHHPDCTNLSWAVRGRLSDWVRTSVKTLSINCDPCSFSETLPLAKGMPVGVPTIRQHAHDTLCAGRGMRRSVRNDILGNRPSFMTSVTKMSYFPCRKQFCYLLHLNFFFFSSEMTWKKISYITFTNDMQVLQWGKKG